jgi:hypothetical protein
MRHGTTFDIGGASISSNSGSYKACSPYKFETAQEGQKINEVTWIAAGVI